MGSSTPLAGNALDSLLDVDVATALTGESLVFFSYAPDPGGLWTNTLIAPGGGDGGVLAIGSTYPAATVDATGTAWTAFDAGDLRALFELESDNPEDRFGVVIRVSACFSFPSAAAYSGFLGLRDEQGTITDVGELVDEQEIKQVSAAALRERAHATFHLTNLAPGLHEFALIGRTSVAGTVLRLAAGGVGGVAVVTTERVPFEVPIG